MDIFPQLIGEKEFKCFTSDDYGAVNGILDEVTAGYILSYLNEPQADKELCEEINKRLKSSIDSLTFPSKLKEQGYVELVKSLSPESLAMSDVNLDELIAKLSYLEENVDKIRTTIPARTSSNYKTFLDAMSGVVSRMQLSGITPTYPDIVARIQANKFLFYNTGEKDHSTGVGILNSKRRQWVVALNGARYLKYCQTQGINAAERSKF